MNNAKSESQKINGGFWVMFWLSILIFAVISTIAIIAKILWIYIASGLIIALLSAYDYWCMKRGKSSNQSFVKIDNGEMTNLYYGPGDNYIHFYKLKEDYKEYPTGTFVVELGFEEVSMKNLDKVKGKTLYHIVILPEDVADIQRFMKGDLGLDAIIKEFGKRLVPITEQYLGHVAQENLGLTTGAEFEEKANTLVLSNELLKEIAKEENELESEKIDYDFLNFLKKRVLLINLSDIAIEGEGYEAHRKAQIQKDKTSLAKEEQETLRETQQQFNIMFKTAIQQAQETFGELSIEDKKHIWDDTKKMFMQKQGADVRVFDGIDQNSFDSKTYVSVSEATVPRKGGPR